MELMRNVQTGEQMASISIAPTPTSLAIRYAVGGIPTAQDFHIVRTPSPFGGSRPWLLCGTCGRRVAVVFRRGGRFTCRHCCRLAYSSQAEDQIGRTWRRQRRLEQRLDDVVRRPKGMRRATHRRIVDRIIECEQARDEAIVNFMRRHGWPEGF